MASVNLSPALKIGMALVGTLVGFILVTTFLSESAGDVGAAAGNMSCAGSAQQCNSTAEGGANVYGFTGLFKKKGILLLIIPVLVFAGLVAVALKTMKG